MTTPFGAACDGCGSLLNGRQAFVDFFLTQERYCTLDCLERAQARRVGDAEKAGDCFLIERGWIDTAGKTRTWNLKWTNGEKIAEVTTYTGAMTLLSLLASR
jgi:hypothetical protein